MLHQPTTPQQDSCSLINAAWNLLKKNLKPSLVIAIVPVIGMIGLNIFITFLQSGNTLNGLPSLSTMMFKFIVALVAMFWSIALSFLWAGSFVVLTRYYFFTVIQDTPLTISQCIQHVRQRWFSFCVYLVCSFLIAVIAFVIETALFFGLSFILTWVLITVQATLSQYMPSLISISFFVIIGFIALLSFIVLIAAQTMLYLFPLLSFATETGDKKSWSSYVKQSMALTFKNMFRITLFLTLLAIITLVINIVVSYPVWLWIGLEVTRLGVGGVQHFLLPFHIHLTLSFLTSGIQLIQFPLQAAALTLFFYDCKVRREGLDIQIWLNRLTAVR